MNILLLILVLLLVFGGLPQISGHWHGLGYGLSGLLGIVLVVIVIVVLLRGGL